MICFSNYLQSLLSGYFLCETNMAPCRFQHPLKLVLIGLAFDLTVCLFGQEGLTGLLASLRSVAVHLRAKLLSNGAIALLSLIETRVHHVCVAIHHIPVHHVPIHHV